MMIPFSDVNLIAVVVATALAMALGFAWYHESVFGTVWMQLSGIKKGDVKNADMKKAMGTGLLATLVSTYFLGVLLVIVGTVNIAEAVTVAVLVWLAAEVPMELHRVAWEGRPGKLMLINSGHALVSFVVAVVVLQWWPW